MTASGSLRRIHLRIYGRVQGVYFRACARDEAVERALAGWVRNRRDGSVELVAEGPAAGLEALCTWASKGPASARVEWMDRTDSEPVGLEPGFSIRPTA